MNVTGEMVSLAIAMLAVLATVTGIFINRFARVDDRISKVGDQVKQAERDLADHKVKAAETYVTMAALASFKEDLVRTEERIMGAVRSEFAALSPRQSRRRPAAPEIDAE